jgi:hypothetical protein
VWLVRNTRKAKLLRLTRFHGRAKNANQTTQKPQARPESTAEVLAPPKMRVVSGMLAAVAILAMLSAAPAGASQLRAGKSASGSKRRAESRATVNLADASDLMLLAVSSRKCMTNRGLALKHRRDHVALHCFLPLSSVLFQPSAECKRSPV